MQQVARTGFAKASTVVVATFSGYWDALSASALAGKAGAPILLTAPGSLSAECRSEIQRLGASKVYIVGGNSSVSQAVERQIRALPRVGAVKRLAGRDAQSTSIAIAGELGKSTTGWAVVATSNGYWDALASAPVAYAKKAPVFLTDATGLIRNDIVASMKKAGVNKALVAGGTGAVSLATERKLKSAGISVVRKGGGNAVDTSRLIAQWAFGQGMTANKMGVATTGGYWDALTGAALCGKNKAVLVLANGSDTRALETVAKGNKSKITQGYIFGGTGALPQSVYNKATAATR